MSTRKREPWKKIQWHGDYYCGYYGDGDPIYQGSDDAEISPGNFGNYFSYKAHIGCRDGQGKYRMYVQYIFDRNSYSSIFSGRFKTKRRAKMAAFREILKFENDRERVMTEWRKVMSPDRRTAIFKRDRRDTGKLEWIASGFAGQDAWNSVSDSKNSGYYNSNRPKVDGIDMGEYPSIFITLKKSNDWENNYPYSWSRFEFSSGCYSGSSGKGPAGFEELEPIIINCIRNGNFDEAMYRTKLNWTLFRHHNYKIEELIEEKT